MSVLDKDYFPLSIIVWQSGFVRISIFVLFLYILILKNDSSVIDLVTYIAVYCRCRKLPSKAACKLKLNLISRDVMVLMF